MSELFENPPNLEQLSLPFISDNTKIKHRFKVGIIGATGAVGSLLINILRERNFPIAELRLFASPSSACKWLETPFGTCQIEELSIRTPPSLDIVFMAAGAAVAKKWGWRLAHRGALVIDKSSYFRNKHYAPLIVPEVNGPNALQHKGIIANPNCTTIPLVMALTPLHKLFELKLITVTSFQSVSGAGKKGMAALTREINDPEAQPAIFTHRIAYNIIPWIGSLKGKHSSEEKKIIQETRRIMGLPRLPIQATATRVPTFVGHCLSVHSEFRKLVNLNQAYEALRNFPGIKIIDEPEKGLYPTPIIAQGKDEVFVGRLRYDRGKHGVSFFVVTDNLRKGAATNAVQIAEYIISIKYS